MAGLHLQASKGSVQAINTHGDSGMAAAVGQAQKEAKYTQGFNFRLDEAGRERTRQIVERFCTALATLLQEVFLQAEKQMLQQFGLTAEFSQEQQRLLGQLSDIIRARSQIEGSVISAVVCAFAALEDQASGQQSNREAIGATLENLKGRIQEAQDLAGLLAVAEKLTAANNSNRPLLMHLNAQLGVVFGMPAHRLLNSPLAPATLIGGLVAGLMSVQADIAAKRLLFQTFEQQFLARLSILLNSIALRLEEEGVQVTRALGFDEENMGPIREVMQAIPPRDEDASRRSRENLEALLDNKNVFVATPRGVVEHLQNALRQERHGMGVAILSDLQFLKQYLKPALLRADIHHEETAFLASVRHAIAEQLNAGLQGKQFPVPLRDFFHRQWPDVLFDVAVRKGIGSHEWTDTVHWQQKILESVTPVRNEEERECLTRLVPDLVKQVRGRLEQAGYSLAETDDFFGQLKQLHLANVQRKLDSSGFVPWETLSLDSCVPEELVMVSRADRELYQQAGTISR